MRHYIIRTILFIYILGAVFTGGLMKAALPPLNAFGVTYVALTWPAALVCNDHLLDCSTLPPPSVSARMFTFD